VITAGCEGYVVITGTFWQLDILDPHALFAATQINPPLNEFVNATVIEFVVEDPVTPVGRVHV